MVHNTDSACSDYGVEKRWKSDTGDEIGGNRPTRRDVTSGDHHIPYTRVCAHIVNIRDVNGYPGSREPNLLPEPG